MAQGSTKVLARKGGDDIGADGRPTKQARSSVLRKLLMSNREKRVQSKAADARRREGRKETEIGRNIIIVVCVDVEDRPSKRHTVIQWHRRRIGVVPICGTW